MTYPAITMIHWPGKDVPACLVHAAKLIELGKFMGFDVSATPILGPMREPIECTNCKNEAAKQVQP